MGKQKRDGLYKRGGIWWIRKDPISGKPISTKCRDIGAAREVRADRERRAADPAYVASQTATLGEWCSSMMTTKGDRSPATRAVLRQKLGHWIRILGEDCPLARIDPAVADRFVLQRREEGVVDLTIAKEFSAITQVLRLAKRAGAWPWDLSTFRPPMLRPNYEPRTRALTQEEVGRLVAVCQPRLRAFVALAVALGARRSEVWRVLPEDLVGEEIRIRGTKTKKSKRTVPVLSVFRPLLETVDRSVLPVDYRRNLPRDLASACKRAGIDRCTANDLRRTHATLLREAGVERDVVRRLLGHTSAALLDRVYDQSRASVLAEAAEKSIGQTRQPRDSFGACDPLSVGASFRIWTGDLRFTKPVQGDADSSAVAAKTLARGGAAQLAKAVARVGTHTGTLQIQPPTGYAADLELQALLRVRAGHVSRRAA